MEDYRLSNDYFNTSKPPNTPITCRSIHRKPSPPLSAKEDFLNAAKDEIERKYGDVPMKAIGLTSKIHRLRTILLE
ncbi:MAG: hypothetical protein ACLULI_12550 [Bacteroides caccae]